LRTNRNHIIEAGSALIDEHNTLPVFVDCLSANTCIASTSSPFNNTYILPSTLSSSDFTANYAKKYYRRFY
jgi:hypothetical protein